MESTSKNGVLIIRVSDAKQEREGLSLDNQEQALRAYSESVGIKIVKEFRFQESADLKIRTRFREVIAFVKARDDVTCIVGYRVDRMTRNYHDHVLLDELRLNEGKELHFVHDRLVIERSTVGRDIQEWDTKVYLAKMYLNRLKEDAVVSGKYKISRGEWPGKAPFGYRNAKADHRSVIVQEPFEASIVKAAYEWYSTGAYSMEQVRSKLRTELGHEFSKGKLDFVLKRPFYYGEMLFQGRLYPHVYEPIISRTTYERVAMVKQKFHKQPFKYAGIDFAYRGLIRCGVCGCSLTPERKRRPNGREYSYYHCTEYKGKHGAEWITEEDLTAQFRALFRGLTIPDEQVRQFSEVLKGAADTKVEYASVARAKIAAERERVERRMRVLYDDRLDDVISRDKYVAKLAEFEDQLSGLAQNMESIDEADVAYYGNAIYLIEICAHAAATFEAGSSERRRELIKLALQNCELKERTLVWELRKPFDTVFSHVGRQGWLPLLDTFRHKRAKFAVSGEELRAVASNSMLTGAPCCFASPIYAELSDV